MAAWSGFAEEDYDSIFITLDKMDKIGLDGGGEGGWREEGYARIRSISIWGFLRCWRTRRMWRKVSPA